MNEFLKYLAEEFEKEGIGRQFDGEIMFTVPLSLGKTIDEEGSELYFMVNRHNRAIYQFKNEDQVKAIFGMVLNGI